MTALIFYVSANLLPIMTTSQLGQETYSTIAGGVVLLWEHGSYLIAVIILVASLFVPLAQIAEAIVNSLQGLGEQEPAH